MTSTIESHSDYPAEDVQAVETTIILDDEEIFTSLEEVPEININDEFFPEEEYISPKDFDYQRLIDEILREEAQEKERREMDAWWAENQPLLAKLTPKRTASEAEMQDEFAKFQALLRSDRETKERKEREHFQWRVSMVAEWYESHPTETSIKLEMDFESQWAIYCKESKQEYEKKALAENQARRLQMIASAALIKAPAGWQGRRKPNGLNAKGKVQGTNLKEKAKEAKIQAKKNKILGKTSDYMGKRAKHRAAMEKHADEIKVVPRELVVPQLTIEEPQEVEAETEEEKKLKEEKEKLAAEEKEQEKIEIEEFLNHVVAPLSTATTLPLEEESDDDFALSLLAAQGKEPDSARSSVSAKSDILPADCSRVGKKIVLNVAQMKAPETLRGRSESKNDHKGPHKTVMCKFAMQGGVCRHGDKCRFAHKLEELNKSTCHFGLGCKLVHKVNDEYVQSGSKTCTFWHPNESLISYAKRLNIPYKTPSIPTPARTPIPSARSIPTPSQVRSSPLRATSKVFVPKTLTPFPTPTPKPEVQPTPTPKALPTPPSTPLPTLSKPIAKVLTPPPTLPKPIAKPEPKVVTPQPSPQPTPRPVDEVTIQVSASTISNLPMILAAIPKGTKVNVVYI